MLLQVLFHAEVASERDDGTGYTIDDVADGIVAKLVRRHPHVFADVAVTGAAEVALNWDEIKKAERAQRSATDPAQVSALAGVPFGQPGLSLASQLQGRAARAGLPDDLLIEPAEPAEADGTRDGHSGMHWGTGCSPWWLPPVPPTWTPSWSCARPPAATLNGSGPGSGLIPLNWPNAGRCALSPGIIKTRDLARPGAARKQCAIRHY